MSPQAARTNAVTNMKDYLAESIEQIDELSGVLYQARSNMAIRHYILDVADDPEVAEAATRIEKQIDSGQPFSDTVDVADLVASVRSSF